MGDLGSESHPKVDDFNGIHFEPVSSTAFTLAMIQLEGGQTLLVCYCVNLTRVTVVSLHGKMYERKHCDSLPMEL